MKQLLVISGANSFLAKELISIINDQFHSIILITNKCNFSIKLNNLPITILDWSEFEKYNISQCYYSTLLHLAFARSTDLDDLALSIKRTSSIFNWAVSNRLTKIINISSQSVYNKFRHSPAKESDPIIPCDAYGFAKYVSELLCRNIFKKSNIIFTNIRLGSVIGPMYKERIINKLLNFALKNKKISIIGGNQIFSYFDYRDAANALLYIITNNSNTLQEVYNLSSNEFFSLSTLGGYICNHLKAVSNMNIEIEIIKKDIYSNNSLDSNLFLNDFSFRQKYSIHNSIINILDSLR